jgi:hypothetical protein
MGRPKRIRERAEDRTGALVPSFNDEEWAALRKICSADGFVECVERAAQSVWIINSPVSTGVGRYSPSDLDKTFQDLSKNLGHSVDILDSFPDEASMFILAEMRSLGWDGGDWQPAYDVVRLLHEATLRQVEKRQGQVESKPAPNYASLIADNLLPIVENFDVNILTTTGYEPKDGRPATGPSVAIEFLNIVGLRFDCKKGVDTWKREILRFKHSR